jgi:thioredoxin 1
MAHEFTEENFEREVLEANSPVLVDFWAEWCAPCKRMLPVIDLLSREMKDVKVGKVNVDENSALAAQYSISSIPALLVFQGGRVVSKMVGMQSAQAIKQKLVALR